MESVVGAGAPTVPFRGGQKKRTGSFAGREPILFYVTKAEQCLIQNPYDAQTIFDHSLFVSVKMALSLNQLMLLDVDEVLLQSLQIPVNSMWWPRI